VKQAETLIKKDERAVWRLTLWPNDYAHVPSIEIEIIEKNQQLRVRMHTHTQNSRATHKNHTHTHTHK